MIEVPKFVATTTVTRTLTHSDTARVLRVKSLALAAAAAAAEARAPGYKPPLEAWSPLMHRDPETDHMVPRQVRVTFSGVPADEHSVIHHAKSGL